MPPGLINPVSQCHKALGSFIFLLCLLQWSADLQGASPLGYNIDAALPDTTMSSISLFLPLCFFISEENGSGTPPTHTHIIGQSRIPCSYLVQSLARAVEHHHRALTNHDSPRGWAERTPEYSTGLFKKEGRG